jgi:hypothetical protein
MNEDLEKLRQIVFQNAALLNDLQAISDREEFIDRVLEIGRTRDLKFTKEDILQAMNEQRRAWIERWI